MCESVVYSLRLVDMVIVIFELTFIWRSVPTLRLLYSAKVVPVFVSVRVSDSAL